YIIRSYTTVDAKKKIQKAANNYLRNSSPAPKKENMPSTVNETETQKNLLNEEISLK
ncbi:hypothetical protein LEP1GSC124_2448, partial [Leptospira interrogans serovar Pyrogenes str. 200701872]